MFELSGVNCITPCDSPNSSNALTLCTFFVICFVFCFIVCLLVTVNVFFSAFCFMGV